MVTVDVKNLALCVVSILALWVPVIIIEILSGLDLGFALGFLTYHIITRFYPEAFS